MKTWTVLVGPAAIRIGKYWRPVLSGDVWLPRRFMTPEAALRYAAQQEAKLARPETTTHG